MDRVPDISVIMPVYNAQDYLKESIQSILSQTFINFEFIIINDGSQDNSEMIIRSFNDSRIKLVNQSNKGVAEALNAGLKLAQGKYIARMDADDISIETRFQIQYNFLENNLEYVCVGSNAILIDEDGEKVCTTKLYSEWEEITKVLPRTPFSHPSVMHRRVPELFYKNVPVVEDSIYFYELSKYGKFKNIEVPLIEYRIHPSAVSRKSKNSTKTSIHILKDYVKNGQVNETLVDQLKRDINKTKQTDKKSNYHLLLAKKFIWNNPNKLKSRKHLQCAFNQNPYYFEIYLLFLLTYLPKRILLYTYQHTIR
jgi:glycosyltransferase involved in cell wall biosynthesis